MRFSPSKDLNCRAPGFYLILLMTFFLIGCASEPVKVDLSANHPANLDSQEAEFAPPPNPFQEDVTAIKGEATHDSMMKPKTHEKSDKKHMNHNMGTKKESRPDSEPAKNSGHGEGDNQHKGHSQ